MTDTAPVSGLSTGQLIINCVALSSDEKPWLSAAAMQLGTLQSEVSRLSVENERLTAALGASHKVFGAECGQMQKREIELRAMVETLRGALTNILAACADTESSYADTVERVGRIADYEINHRTAALNKADAEVRE